MGNMVKPNLLFSVDDGVVSMKSQSTFKTTETKFKLDEEFDETTADDRHTKVSFQKYFMGKQDMLVLLESNVSVNCPLDRDYLGKWKTGAETDLGW